MSISLVLPSYKEAENLSVLLPQIKKSLYSIGTEFEILIIDTMNAMDETKRICEEEGVTYLNRAGGNTYGDAIRTGIKSAKYKYIVVMDSDGSHNPSDLVRLFSEAKNLYDIVIASRYIKGGHTHNGFISKLMSKTVNLTYRIVFDLKIHDVSNSFRIYDANKIKSINLECNNFDIVEEILIRLKIKYPLLAIKEIPAKFNKREFGKSKRNLVLFVLSYLVTMKHLYKIMRKEQILNENNLHSRE